MGSHFQHSQWLQLRFLFPCGQPVWLLRPPSWTLGAREESLAPGLYPPPQSTRTKLSQMLSLLFNLPLLKHLLVLLPGLNITLSIRLLTMTHRPTSPRLRTEMVTLSLVPTATSTRLVPLSLSTMKQVRWASLRQSTNKMVLLISSLSLLKQLVLPLQLLPHQAQGSQALAQDQGSPELPLQPPM